MVTNVLASAVISLIFHWVSGTDERHFYIQTDDLANTPAQIQGNNNDYSRDGTIDKQAKTDTQPLEIIIHFVGLMPSVGDSKIVTETPRRFNKDTGNELNSKEQYNKIFHDTNLLNNIKMKDSSVFVAKIDSHPKTTAEPGVFLKMSKNPNDDIINWENPYSVVNPLKLIAKTFGIDAPPLDIKIVVPEYFEAPADNNTILNLKGVDDADPINLKELKAVTKGPEYPDEYENSDIELDEEHEINKKSTVKKYRHYRNNKQHKELFHSLNNILEFIS